MSSPYKQVPTLIWTPEDCLRAVDVEPVSPADVVEETEFNISIPADLENALEAAAACRAQIPEAKTPLLELLEIASDETEKQARFYQIDLLEWQLNRAADLAERRLEYIYAIKTDEDVVRELAKCSGDIFHWFEMYAWGVDPRPDAPLSLMPFGLFDFQKRFVEWLEYITFIKRMSGAVEKARDMGATETALRWVLHRWLYKNNFRALILSANEDLVDSKKDPDTLFEKIRLQMRMLPDWMLPKGFKRDRDMPYMAFANPENNSVILGDAPTGNVGRQRRSTVILRDEFAAWQHGGYPQHTALSRSTNTNVSISSVQGKFNKFSDLTHDAHTAKFEMDWREHPWRDERWFNALKFGYLGDAMTVEEIAQEVERNYEASQPGRVLKNVQEPYCFITYDEMVNGFERLGMNRHEFFNGFRPMLPLRWNWGRVTDYGESARQENDTHIWAYSLFCRPGERQPLEDSLFFFYSLPIEPIGATELQGFAFYSALERNLGLRSGNTLIRKPDVNDMSHEATDPKEVLLKQCGDNWGIPDLDFDKGRRKLVFHFEVIDKHKPNPFRPELEGRCRIYFVALPAEDGSQEYFMAKNERTGQYFVTPSKSQGGFKRLRAEIGAWHYPPEERGKPVPGMRPKPVFDDIITTVRYAVARWGVSPKPLTKQERREAALPVHLQNVTEIIKTHGEGEAERVIIARQMAFSEMDKREKANRAMLSKYRPQVPKMRIGRR
jgi:hypothetical protein